MDGVTALPGSLHALTLPGVAGQENGPITHSRLRRSRLVHLALCALGILPWLAGASPHFQAFGWGLWLPGLGFVAVGGWALLLLPVTLLLFAAAFIAWFGSGMIIAPLIIWGGAALLAGAMAGPHPAAYAPIAVPVLTFGFLGTMAWRRREAFSKAEVKRTEREQNLPETVAEIRAAAIPAPPMAERELDLTELSLLRYVLDRALQPVGELNGFDIIDQFQTSALRYQLNQAGWTLAAAQRHHMPNFHGYISEGQRRVIEQYRQKKIWGYWQLENAWGNLSLDTDPAKKDNIMLTGYININTLLYMINTGDHRYGEPGGMTFMSGKVPRHVHDVHSINQSLIENYQGKYSQAFCLYPCEPNWIYPACNFRGLTAMRLYDTLYGTGYFAGLSESFRRNLEQEFTKVDGGIVPLRSKLTGHALPFPVPDSINATMLSPLYPDLAEKYWAMARHDSVYHENGKLKIRLPEKSIDFGNYKSGLLFVMYGLLGAATEFGDREVVDAVRQLVMSAGKREDRDGVTHFKASNMANLSVVESLLGVTHGWRDSILTMPPEAARTGPILAEAAYPDVLVAHAYSTGDDLSLSLYPGLQPGPQTLGLARLRPSASYHVDGAANTSLVADAQGKASLTAILDGRTVIKITPEP